MRGRMRGLAAGHERTNPTSTAKRRLSTLILAAIVGLDLLRAGVQLYELKPGAAKSSLSVRGRFGPAKVSGLDVRSDAADDGLRHPLPIRLQVRYGDRDLRQRRSGVRAKITLGDGRLLDRWLGRPLATRTPLE
jgi:hypothetical protein